MRRLAGRKEQGVTLVELMIVAAILGMVVAAMYNMFTFQQHSYAVQDNVAVMQQNVRVGLEYMVKEIRMAGYIPEDIPGGSGGVSPNADVGGGAPFDGVSEPIEEATANTIIFQADIDDDEKTETVRYVLSYDAGQNSTMLTREVWEWNGSWGASTGPQIIADNIDTLTFTYTLLADDQGVTGTSWGVGFDDDDGGNGPVDEQGELLTWNFAINGALNNNKLRSYIRQIHVAMTAKSPAQDSNYFHPTQGDHYRRRTLSSNISLRNM